MEDQWNDRPSGDAAGRKAADAAQESAVRLALVESRRQILHFLQRRLASAEAAEEVLQVFMLKAIERADQLRDVQTVRGWLGRILATSVIDHMRRASRRRQREAVVSPTDLESVEIATDAELDAAACTCLYKLLPTIRPDYAEVIRRVDLEGEPRETVAAGLGITANNLAVRLHRGRMALKQRLVDMCLTCPIHGFLDCRCEEAERARRRREDQPRESTL